MDQMKSAQKVLTESAAIFFLVVYVPLGFADQAPLSYDRYASSAKGESSSAGKKIG